MMVEADLKLVEKELFGTSGPPPA
ncbi:MAG: hypothetical protein H6Q89_2698, partial [Myxococcaceae bacterium]|nr:hypothetical protein [Myxococcaceae bacterium]